MCMGYGWSVRTHVNGAGNPLVRGEMLRSLPWTQTCVPVAFRNGQQERWALWFLSNLWHFRIDHDVSGSFSVFVTWMHIHRRKKGK